MSKKNGARHRVKPRRFEVDETLSAEDAAGSLERVAAGLREGVVVLESSDGQSLTLPATGDFDFELDVKQGKKKSRIQVELTFAGSRDASAAEEDEDESTDEEDEETAVAAATIPDEMSF